MDEQIEARRVVRGEVTFHLEAPVALGEIYTLSADLIVGHPDTRELATCD